METTAIRAEAAEAEQAASETSLDGAGPERGTSTRARTPRHSPPDLGAVWARAEATHTIAQQIEQQADDSVRLTARLHALLRSSRLRRRTAWTRRPNPSPAKSRYD